MILKQKAQDIAKAFTKWGLWQGGTTPQPPSGGGSLKLEDVVLFEDTENGWLSGDITFNEELSTFDFITFEIGNIGDGGYHGTTRFSKFVKISSLLELGGLGVPLWFKRFVAFAVGADNKSFTNLHRQATDENFNNYAPIIYKIIAHRIIE